MKILLVEDDPFIAENTRLILTRHGYEVSHLGEGGGVPQKVLAESPDLILLDVMMPGQNGVEVCRELKAHSTAKNIPLILLSAKTQPDDIRIGLESGADGYLLKPCRSKELLEKIQELLADRSKVGQGGNADV